MNPKDEFLSIDTQFISVIKAFREFGLKTLGFSPGLKETKDFCDALREQKERDGKQAAITAARILLEQNGYSVVRY
jgi:ribosomal protein L7/L12